MSDSAPIHFEGSIPNASRTPRNEVGGLAVFEGVLMRSRTGFAIAVRRKNGAITVRQFPYASLVYKRRGWGFPVVRGAAALAEMMVIGTRALRYSSDMIDESQEEERKETSPKRLAFLLFNSLLMVAALFVLLPNVGASAIMHYTVLNDWLNLSEPGNAEADYPFLFNIISGVIRLALLAAYILGLAISPDIRRVFQYHGAEHKSVLALEEGKDVSVARAREHDTIHPRCGTTLLALAAILSIIVFAAADEILRLYVSGYPGWHYVLQKSIQLGAHLVALPLIIGLSFELVKYCGRRWDLKWCRWMLWPGLLFQRLTTRQPDDHQLEVAIVALFGALAIPSYERGIRTYTVRGLEDDESAPGYVPQSPARPVGPSEPAPNHHPAENAPAPD